jgi:hypothetical protein
MKGCKLLGALRICGWVDLVGEDVFCLGPGYGEIQASEQLDQGFTFSPYQHGQGISSLVGHSDTFRDRRKDPDADPALSDYLLDVRQVWESACGGVRSGGFV